MEKKNLVRLLYGDIFEASIKQMDREQIRNIIRNCKYIYALETQHGTDSFWRNGILPEDEELKIETVEINLCDGYKITYIDRYEINGQAQYGLHVFALHFYNEDKITYCRPSNIQKLLTIAEAELSRREKEGEQQC